MIWEYAASEPRTVKLFVIEKQAGGQAETMQVAGQTKHPGILYACRESRAVGLKAYEECVTLESSRNGGPVGSKTVFVNFSVDRFIFEVPTLHRFAVCYSKIPDFNFKRESIRRIQHIEILRPKDAIYDQMFYRNLRLLLGIAKVVSVRLTIFDRHSKHPNPSVDEAKDCLDSISTFQRCIQCRIKMTNLLPKLEFHWRTTGDKDIDLCPCASSEDPPSGRKKLKLCIVACSLERKG
jgi:hypothetical protein